MLRLISKFQNPNFARLGVGVGMGGGWVGWKMVLFRLAPKPGNATVTFIRGIYASLVILVTI